MQLRIQGETITGYDERTGTIFTAGRWVEGVYSCAECVHFDDTEAGFVEHLKTHR
jgi:hypothetical protein